MFIKTISFTLVLVVFIAKNSEEFRFSRTVTAIGNPYYKIIMALGTCKETLLYTDQKIWGKIVLNRILDIYFKCDDERYKISRVEINIIINNTSCYAYSEEGVGNSEFSATLFLPTNLSFVVYLINIYSCYRGRESAEITTSGKGESDPLSHTYLPFLHNDNYSNRESDGK